MTRGSLAMMFAAIAAVATVLTLAMPLLAGDTLAKRMKSVALEREKIRQRERERLARGEKVDRCGHRPSNTCRQAVESFNLEQMGRPGGGAREADPGRLSRRRRPTSPFCSSAWSRRRRVAVRASFYVFVVLELDQPAMVKVGICIFAAYIGMHLPLAVPEEQDPEAAVVDQAALFRTRSTCC